MNATTIVVAAVVLLAACVIVSFLVHKAVFSPHVRALMTHRRMLEALTEDMNKGIHQPQQAFYDAIKRGQPHLLAALEYDTLIGEPDRPRYDSFWRALWVQDSEFWAALDRGDESGWTQMEREHGVRVLPGQVALPSAGGRPPLKARKHFRPPGNG